MGRKVVLKTIMTKSSAILPLTINTLYNEDAEDLNNIPERCNVISNMIGIRHKLQRLRLTAAEAQCAALASNQVFMTEKMFVVHKNANAIGKWISQEYKEPNDYDCFINAQLMQADHPSVVNEESVSFPFLNADIHRFKNIRVAYVDFQGTKKQQQIDGFKSFAFQQAWDYSFGRHIVDWRLHHGTLKVQDNVQKNLPKVTSVLEQYNQELKNLTQKYPKMFVVPQKIEQSQIGWFTNRGGQEISIESDYVSRIHKHYRKEMLIFLEKLSLNLV